LARGYSTMLTRKHFITNSSSTGFVAWGCIVTKKEADKIILLEDGPVEVGFVSPKQRAVYIKDSVKYTYSDDEEIDVDEGVYLLEPGGYNGSMTAKCTATKDFFVSSPPNWDYDEWEKVVNKTMKSCGAFDIKTYQPKWMYVRTYS
jgi:hypothetical protein